MANSSLKNISYKNFYKNIQNKQIKPVCIFNGDQTLLIDKTLSELKRVLITGSEDFNYTQYYADSCTIAEIIDTAKTLPMFSDKRIVVVKNAEILNSSDFKTLNIYIQSPSPYTCLVLIITNKKKINFDKNDQTVLIDFNLGKTDLIPHIRDIAENLGCKISTQAAENLLSLVGDNLQEIQMELEKASLYAAENNIIDNETIERLTEKINFEDTFQLVNSIASKDKPHALRALMDIESTREEPLVLLNNLNRRFKLIWQAKEFADDNVPKEQILKKLKISSGAFYYINKETQKFSYENLRWIINILDQQDRRLKSSSIPQEISLTKLVLDLCG